MKNIILAFALIVVSVGQAQILKPVKWEASVKKISDTEYELIATANIDEHWHLYSQTVSEGGPIATTFTFQGNGKFLKKGNTIEDEGQTIDDPVFGMKIKFFETKVSFKQRIKLKTKEAFKVNATVEFMVCDDSRCLPPTEVDLVFNVN
ncbi:protein-disulfide reductase DsbD domain-containing protein [Yeosuana marina]|uniref:protein-disulfide reductase DsbD domain-containing protein n=1 Tax=Yeosuana marina TaxID=1565536 RepID=UPI0030C8A843